MATGYVWNELYAWHDTGSSIGIFPAGGFNQPHHAFESAESKSRIASLIEVSGLLDGLLRIPALHASEEDLLRAHTREHVDRIATRSRANGGDGGDGFTPFGHGSYEIATLAAGGAIAATEAVLTGQVDNAYALVRPPGHHATADQGMGYCLFSNVSVAVEHARATFGVERIAVVDYDVHHGNGAQSIFWDDPSVLTVSVHQERLFPQDSGDLIETGGADARGTAVNVPLPAGSGNGAYFAAIDRVAVPAVHAFQPDLIMVSSGFDPSAVDPLGCMTVTASGFKGIATRLLALADDVCAGRIVFSHEGGYSPVHAPFCGVAVLEAMSGMDTGVGDPFAISFEDSPAHPLKPWQDDVIGEAVQLMRTLSQ